MTDARVKDQQMILHPNYWEQDLKQEVTQTRIVDEVAQLLWQ